KDSRYLIPYHEPVGRIATSTHIRILVWSDINPKNPDKEVQVEIKIDGVLHPNPVRFAGTKKEDQTEEHEFLPLYVSEWDPLLYKDGKDHEISVKVIDGFGRVGITKSIFR